jgi:hypothetical protein
MDVTMHLLLESLALGMVIKTQTWTVVGSVATVLMLIWTVGYTVTNLPKQENPNQGVSLFLLDSTGKPRTDLIALFPDGQSIEPNRDGLVIIPIDLKGQQISIREYKSRREINSLVLTDSRVLYIRLAR